MSKLEELLELTKFLEKESKDVNMNDISQVISFLKKYIDCQNKIINVFKENYDRKTIELSKHEQALEILKDKFNLKVQALHLLNSEIQYELQLREHCTTYCFSIPKDIYELLKEVLEDE